MKSAAQLSLFNTAPNLDDIEKVLLYALGDFQARGKLLVDRELAFDRLRGAFLRAFSKFGVEELPDKSVAEGLKKIGASVTEVPSFVAKHPYRVVVGPHTAQMARTYYAGLSRTNVTPRAARPHLTAEARPK